VLIQEKETLEAELGAELSLLQGDKPTQPPARERRRIVIELSWFVSLLLFLIPISMFIHGNIWSYVLLTVLLAVMLSRMWVLVRDLRDEPRRFQKETDRFQRQLRAWEDSEDAVKSHYGGIAPLDDEIKSTQARILELQAQMTQLAKEL
jgi:hypothetical protein